MLFDTHLHTEFCGHALGLPRDYLPVAQRRGFTTLCFTCHVPMPVSGFGGSRVRMAPEQLPDYLRSVEEAREAGAALGIEVLTGIEAEVSADPAAMAAMDAVLEGRDWDFVLGSLHHQLPHYQEHLAANNLFDDAAILEDYFATLTDAVQTGRYHSIAHPDVIRMYGTLQGRFEPQAHEAVIRFFLRAARDAGVCLEVNTSGLIKGDYIAHPDPLILDWCREEGVRLTLGADAHAPRMLGQYFDETLPLLDARGIEQVHYVRGGQPQAVPVKALLERVGPTFA